MFEHGVRGHGDQSVWHSRMESTRRTVNELGDSAQEEGEWIRTGLL